MAGALTISTLNDSSGTLATQNGMTGITKGWVCFNGTSGTIRGSFNVSSITRHGTGQYTANFTTALANTNFCVFGMSGRVSGGATNITLTDMSESSARTTTSFRVETCQSNTGSLVDGTFVSLAAVA